MWKRTVGSIAAIIIFTLISALHGADSLKTYDTRAIDAFMDGMDLEAAGDFEQAILAYKRAISYDPQAVDIHFSLAKLYLQSQQKDLAQASLLNVIKYDSRHVDALELLGEMSQSDQEHVLALGYFERVLDID